MNKALTFFMFLGRKKRRGVDSQGVPKADTGRERKGIFFLF